MDFLRALLLVALTSTVARAEPEETEPLPNAFSLGIGSTFAGEPALVSQQWKTERAGVHYTVGIRWDRLSVMDSSTNVFALDVGTYFMFKIGQRSRTRAMFLLGGEGSAVTADGVRGGSALFALGIQVQRRVTETIGIYAQSGISLGFESRAAQIRADAIDPGEEATRLRVRATPLDLVGSLGLMWWLF